MENQSIFMANSDRLVELPGLFQEGIRSEFPAQRVLRSIHWAWPWEGVGVARMWPWPWEAEVHVGKAFSFVQLSNHTPGLGVIFSAPCIGS